MGDDITVAMSLKTGEPEIGHRINLAPDNVKECPLPRPRPRAAAAFMLALLVFAAANLLFSCFSTKEGSLAAIGNRTWSWWTLNDLNQLRSCPNVVLLGSSLMVAGIAECDANYRQKNLDLAYYRDAAYLSACLQKAFGGQFQSLNLSAPGQMPSDAYLTLSAAIKQGLQPKIVFYGLAPRDFMDGTMQNPSESEAFQVLRHFVETDNYCFDFYVTPVGRLDWILQKCSALYGGSFSVRRAMVDAVANAFPLAEKGEPQRVVQLYLKRRLTPLAVDPGTSFALPTTPNTPLLDDTADYKARYKNPAKSIYQAQFKFLQRLADVCKQNKIKLVLLQMPITRKNVKLLKPALYNAYNTDLQLLAERNNLPLMDLCQFEDYDQSDYKDTVHLNGYGGKKFVDNLVSHLSACAYLADDMVAASNSHNQRALAATGGTGM